MSTAGAPRAASTPASTPDDEVAAPLYVHSCSRLGRRANPPRLTIADWLLSGRRR
ncbi:MULTISPECIES: hypothetical protein [Mycolicibacterium]|uniref:Uncharacterized protein n=2 Tax=Mycolicibacterium TaxID=1866885 RepID=A0A9X2YTW4_9MYCO|nr:MULTISPECIES: hypothetical protein [Mycolicibacterium]MCV7173335.1 hypothetical protein [[Mycobacterium] manitobense]MDO3637713.1 hypothetical protein [Mycolicibacterium arseniciresistens]